MSTELESPKISESPSAVAAPPAKEVVTANGSSARLPKVWQRRRFQAGAGILAALILAGILANNVIARQAQLLVQRSGDRRYGLYPVWRIVVAPARLTFAIPEGVGGVAVDGEALDLKAGTSDVAVLPLSHKVTFGGTPLLATQTVTAD